jgi:hypothetical protein
LGESGSGVATVTPSQDLTSEGAGQSRTGTCSDHAGNTVTATVGDINIDRTAPTLAGSRTPAANAFGWTNQDVSVAWVCTDALSGAATVTEGQIVTAEGVNQSRDGACTDRAGNSVAGTVSGISIDKRAPDITGNRTPAANAFGWNNGDVMVFWTCRDPGLSIPGSPLGESGSGVATVTASEDLTTEGAGQSRTGTCTDRAGNMATATVSDINVDRSVPTITFTGNAGSYTVDQTVAIACGASDALSGIDPARTSCPGAQGPAYGFALGSNTIQATATDLADNATAGSTTFTVEVTYQGLGSLVDRFVADGGVANSLTTKLRAAESARNANARAGQLGAFVNQLNALRGRQLSAEHADLLIALSRGL